MVVISETNSIYLSLSKEYTKRNTTLYIIQKCIIISFKFSKFYFRLPTVYIYNKQQTVHAQNGLLFFKLNFFQDAKTFNKLLKKISTLLEFAIQQSLALCLRIHSAWSYGLLA